MRNRPFADRVFDHRTLALLATTYGVVSGIVGGVLSLVLRWPGMEHAGSTLQLAAAAHAPLFILFSALPAVVGGLAISTVVEGGGARNIALPSLSVGGLALSIAALGATLCGLMSVEPALLVAAASLAALSVIAIASNLIATVLISRTRPYSGLDIAVWNALIGATLLIISAPLSAGAFTAAMLQGGIASPSLDQLLEPLVVSLLIISVGFVDRVFGGSGDVSVRRIWSVVALAAVAFFLCLMDAERTLLHGWPGGLDRVQAVLLLAAIAPLEIGWLRQLVRKRIATRAATLFGCGFAVVLSSGLLSCAAGYTGHEAISLAIVFAMLAAFHDRFSVSEAGWLNRHIALGQFWLMLAGSLVLLTPVPARSLLGTIGSAALAVGLLLFAAQLATALLRAFAVGAAGGRFVGSISAVDRGSVQ